MNKNYVIFPAAAMVSLAAGLVNLGIIFYMQDRFHVGSDKVGQLMSLSAIMYVTGCLVGRKIFERFSPARLLSLSTLLSGFVIFLIIYAPNLYAVFVVFPLFGVCLSFFWPPIIGWLSQEREKQELNHAIAWFNVSWSAGQVISPYLAGCLSQAWPVLPLWTSFAFFFAASFFLFMYGRRVLQNVPVSRQSVLDLGKKEDTPLRYPAWIGGFSSFVVLGVIAAIFPVYARTDLHISKSLIGLLLLVRSLFNTMTFIFLGRSTRWHFKIWPMIAVNVGIISFVWLMHVTETVYLLAILFALMGFLGAYTYSANLLYSVYGSAARSRRSAIHEAVLNAGLIVGYFFGGLLNNSFSMGAVYVFCTAVLVAGMVTQIAIIFRFQGGFMICMDKKINVGH